MPKQIGRPKKITDQLMEKIMKMRKENDKSWKTMGEELNQNPSTIASAYSRWMREKGRR